MSLAALGPRAVTRRLRRVAELADLRPERRLAGKIDMSPAAVTRRLRRCADLRRLCVACAEWGRERRS